jgi:ABC-2 type transport system permease protein
MKTDLSTVMWKEWRGVWRYRGSRRIIVLNLVMPVLMFGVLLPIQEGQEFFKSGLTLIGAFIIPVLLVGMTVPESFAGERERHTLDTLLASRLPDKAILFGKAAVSVAFGWGVSLLVLLMGLVTANILNWDGRLQSYTATILFSSFGLSLFVSLLVAGLGVLISMRAESVQKATQNLVFSFMIVPLLLQVAGIFVVQGGPEKREQVLEVLATLGSTSSLLLMAAGFVALDLLVCALAVTRFQRSRLISDLTADR